MTTSVGDLQGTMLGSIDGPFRVISTHWLIEALASHITGKVLAKKATADPRLADMQFWCLEVHEDHRAVLTCRADSGVKPAIRQEIPFTDFPLSQVAIWAAFEDEYWILCLPSER